MPIFGVRIATKITCLFAVTQRGATEREETDTVNPVRGLHDQQPCSGLSRHSGRELERRRDFGSHGLWVENLPAPGHVSHRLAEAIVHRSVGLPKNDRI